MEELGYAALALVTAGIGALGGLGGAVLLVPVLVLTGMPASEAAPLGLLTVAAGSIAAGPHQLEERTVNHRLGVVTELAASTGAVAGALVSGVISDVALTYLLAVVAFAAALAGVRRTGLRNPPDPACERSDIGERVGALAGAYPLGEQIVPYRTNRLAGGLGFMGLAGFIAGTAGASGGFIKTPATAELMHVPMKVAAATTTFTVGITSSAALVVFALQGRIDAQTSAVVVVGSLVGGQLGARLQSDLSPALIRRVLSVLLVVVATVLVVRA
ncbi:MAG TPA: sulfite exporter TauE/SafE family protein [Acidimicrobiales bacterium]|nr:sulfite exporter TauE/SafE family protein [Acidimicrobiales bacterium]